MTIKCSEFVKRQTSDSQFSHFSGSWEQLEKMVELNRTKGVQGYRDGVFLVPLPAEGFFTGIVEIKPDTKLIATFEARRDGEDAFINVTAKGNKLPAKHVDIVIYSRAVLQENNEATTDADYEIVSINARSTNKPTPMDPVTMMRNFFELKGGTKGEFSAQDFAESIRFWSQHTPCAK
jgi:hypothetical protein